LFTCCSDEELLESYKKGGDEKCVTQDQVEEVLELGDPTAGVGAVYSSDVSYPQKRSKKDWRTTETN